MSSLTFKKFREEEATMRKTHIGDKTRGRSLLFAVILALTSATNVYADPILVGLQPGGSGSTDILRIDASPFSVSTTGAAGGSERLSGLDVQPGTNTLFASSGLGGINPGSLFTVDRSTGIAALVGATGFAGVSGLVFDFDGTLFGSTFSNPAVSFADILITIDPNTGVGTVVGPYGSGIEGIDGLGVDPITGTLYGVGAGTFFDELFTINKTTGAAVSLGSLGDEIAGLAMIDPVRAIQPF